MPVGLANGRTLILVCSFTASSFTGLNFATGEAVIITRSGVSRRQVSEPATFAPDIFEYVYFARPDSVLDGISVYRSRMAMGDALAVEVQKVLDEHKITVDVVIPVRTFHVTTRSVF